MAETNVVDQVGAALTEAAHVEKGQMMVVCVNENHESVRALKTALHWKRPHDRMTLLNVAELTLPVYGGMGHGYGCFLHLLFDLLHCHFLPK